MPSIPTTVKGEDAQKISKGLAIATIFMSFKPKRQLYSISTGFDTQDIWNGQINDELNISIIYFYSVLLSCRMILPLLPLYCPKYKFLGNSPCFRNLTFFSADAKNI